MAEKPPDLARGTALTLYNRFAELMLVVGLDENTGLVPIKEELDHSHSDEEVEAVPNHLFHKSYEAQVLAAISASKALVFQPSIKEDPMYPPSVASMTAMSNFQTVNPKPPVEAPVVQSATSSHRISTVNPAVLKEHLLNGERSSSSTNSISGLPLSNDAIGGITTFCFPDNAHIHKEKQDKGIHFLVLTDVSGSKTYATCLTFYKPYWLVKNENENVTCIFDNPNSSRQVPESAVHCYLPQCCVLVSKYPYFYAMKECLSCMISHVERDMEEMYSFLKDFTYTMTMAPVPPAGDVIVEMSVCNLSVSLVPSESPEKPVIDIPLHLAFLCFPADELLKIFTAILCEERLVFVSYNYALLTIIMESFLYFILPLDWRFTYVPILSDSSLELLDAPGTFMMGCHSKHLDDVVKVPGLVVVNIDEGVVRVNTDEDCPPSPALTDNRQSFVFVDGADLPFPSLPTKLCKIFKNICKRARFQMELTDVQRPFFYNLEEERTFRMKKCLQFNTEISFIFLEMMVNLFRGILPFLKKELQIFNKPNFMDTISEDDKPFYAKVLTTEMFKQFVEDRLKGKMDYWSDLERRTQTQAKRGSGPFSSHVQIIQRHQQQSLSKNVFINTFNSLSPRIFETFRLPTLNDSVSYVKSIIAILNKNIEESKNIHIRSSYIYLRGMFHAALHNVDSALSDLLSLHAHNSRLLPKSFVHKLLLLVPEEERVLMLRRRGITDLHDIVSTRPSPRPKFMGEVPIPDGDLNFEEFIKTVSLLEMATDYEAIQRLFAVLSNPEQHTYVNKVDKYTFDVFRLCYKENIAQCDTLVLPNDSLQPNEMILKISSLIKTDYGTGRIVLTHKRLFFIKDVSNRCREIIKLRNVAKLEKLQLLSFLVPVDVLVITEIGNKSKFTAWLKSERNCFAALIEEMRAGKVVAEAIKDFSTIGHSVQNVLIMDAVIRSGQDPSVAHFGYVAQALEILGYFTSLVAGGHHILPKETTSALQHRVDPNIGQRERRTVICMLYTTGRSNHSIPPRLWCGMGDGKVRVFDATNWALEESFVQTKNTVSALAAIGEGQVWAASHGIFIIDTATINCNRTLMDHPDLVVDIVLAQHGRQAYSASVDGTVFEWDVQSLRVTRRVFLTSVKSLRSMQLYHDKLWCASWQYVIALDLEGNTLAQLSFVQPETGKVAELDCFGVFKDEIWAGCRRVGQIIVWDESTGEEKMILKLEDSCSGISAILHVGTKVWVGTKDGTIHIFDCVEKQLWKTIQAHDDAVRSLSAAESRYIMSGAGSKDGKVAIWSPNVATTITESGTHL